MASLILTRKGAGGGGCTSPPTRPDYFCAIQQQQQKRGAPFRPPHQLCCPLVVKYVISWQMSRIEKVVKAKLDAFRQKYRLLKLKKWLKKGLKMLVKVFTVGFWSLYSLMVHVETHLHPAGSSWSFLASTTCGGVGRCCGLEAHLTSISCGGQRSWSPFMRLFEWHRPDFSCF